MSIYVEPTPTPAARFGLLEAAALQPAEGRWQMGVQFEPSCGLAHLTVGACIAAPMDEQDIGDVTVNVSEPGVATLNGPIGDPGQYVIDWGDGAQTTGATLTNRTHTYADGDFDITITGPGGYHATILAVHVHELATGPFTGDALDSTPASKDPGWDSTIREADPFAVYHLAQCRAPGGGIATAERRARRSFEQAEGRAVEEWFGAYLSSTAAGGVDLNAGGALTAKHALALLEEYAGTHYGGTPVIHADRATATILGADNAIGRQGQRLETVLGSSVAAGAGYALGEPGAPQGAVPAGERWLYVTGGVYVWRGGEPIVTEPMLQRGTGGGYLNDFLLLVERPYVVATECMVAAVRVKLDGLVLA